MIKHYKILDSTIIKAKEMIDSGLVNESLTIVASEQTNGISSKENISWHSPYGNLYFTAIIKKDNIKIPSYYLLYITSVILAEWIESSFIYLKPMIKWPNDILINGKKVAGILAQDYKNYFILSIGLNLVAYPKKTYNFPASSLLEMCNKEDVNLLNYIAISEFINQKLSLFLKHNVCISFEEIRSRWIKYAYKLNEEVEVIGNDVKFIFRGINNDGEIILEDKNGICHFYQYGEIRFC